jgi:hypothetical protein
MTQASFLSLPAKNHNHITTRKITNPIVVELKKVVEHAFWIGVYVCWLVKAFIQSTFKLESVLYWPLRLCYKIWTIQNAQNIIRIMYLWTFKQVRITVQSIYIDCNNSDNGIWAASKDKSIYRLTFRFERELCWQVRWCYKIWTTQNAQNI